MPQTLSPPIAPTGVRRQQHKHDLDVQTPTPDPEASPPRTANEAAPPGTRAATTPPAATLAWRPQQVAIIARYCRSCHHVWCRMSPSDLMSHRTYALLVNRRVERETHHISYRDTCNCRGAERAQIHAPIHGTCLKWSCIAWFLADTAAWN